MIPFIDLHAQYREIQDEVEAAVLRVLRGGQYIMGPEVADLELELRRFVGAEHCISCASGTDALVMTLMAMGVGPGDAVFTPPFTFVATAEAIALVGATPVFVDVDAATFNLDPDGLAWAVRAVRESDSSLYPLPRLDSDQLPRLTPKAIMAVDLFGLPADYGRIQDIAAREQLLLIEDAAQSFGGELGSRRAGSLGNIGCTSFFPAKPLGCYGDGGAIFTNDSETASVLKSIRVHGQGADRYQNIRLGMTGRLDTIQAAVLLAKLPLFVRELAARQRVARTYTSRIEAAGLELETPRVPEGYKSAWAQYSVLAAGAEDRDRLVKALTGAGVPTAIYYPTPLHLQQAFAYLSYTPGDFPASEDVSSRIFSLPMHPYLDEDSIRLIVGKMAAAL